MSDWTALKASDFVTVGHSSDIEPWAVLLWPNGLGNHPSDAMGKSVRVTSNGETRTFAVCGHDDADTIYLRDVAAPLEPSA